MAKYGRDDSKSFTKLGSRSHGKSSWKKIGLGWENFHKNISWTVGREDRIKLWEDS